MTSRDRILATLRKAPRPFQDVAPAPERYIPMVPLDLRDRASLRRRFIEEAEKLACIVHQSPTPGDAIETILELLGEDKALISWSPQHIPLPGLAAALNSAAIAIAPPTDPDIRVGLSGADAALAGTGSLVVTSGAGKWRTASLLPPLHIAVITPDQIVPGMEEWLANQQADNLATLRQSSNVVIISGPSRTADIAMELILGMHGPAELHIIIVGD